MDIETLKRETSKDINTLAINPLGVVNRLVGVKEHPEDIYYLFEGDNGLHLSSITLGYIPLKGYIPEESYLHLLRGWNLNHENKVV